MNNNQYDEIKDLLKRSRLLTEQPIGAPNIGNDIEAKIEKYRQKTPQEKLELRSIDSGPFNQKLTDFIDKNIF